MKTFDEYYTDIIKEVITVPTSKPPGKEIGAGIDSLQKGIQLQNAALAKQNEELMKQVQALTAQLNEIQKQMASQAKTPTTPTTGATSSTGAVKPGTPAGVIAGAPGVK